MKYEITVIVDENGKNRPRKVTVIKSEELLTVKEVKAKCLADVAVDTTKLAVTLEELWLSNSSRVKDPAADDLILSERNERVDYYLSLVTVEVPAAPAKPTKSKKAKAAAPTPVETPAEPVVETPAADATPEETI